MQKGTEALMQKYYSNTKHPYQRYRDLLNCHLNKSSAVLDIGCGHDAPELRRLVSNYRSGISVGIDLIDFTNHSTISSYVIKADASHLCFKNNSFDLVISRSVLEHLSDPLSVFRQVNHALRSDGHFIFLTPNRYDYSSLFSKLIPNRYHQSIVSKTEGRSINDVFPTFYRANSYNSVKSLANKSGFSVISFDYLGQYPAYLTFSTILFLLGTAFDKIICRYDCLKVLRGWILVSLKKVECLPPC
jgi:SAM-dependent methyltransferase